MTQLILGMVALAPLQQHRILVPTVQIHADCYGFWLQRVQAVSDVSIKYC